MEPKKRPMEGTEKSMISYDAAAALQAIDRNALSILLCLAGALGFSFVYFLIGVRMAIRQQVYVVPFLGAALFFWHDLGFVMRYDLWFNHYDHWWLKGWWFGLIGTVALELFLLGQFVRYGRKELFPELSEAAFAGLTLIGVIGVGAMWFLVKGALNDPLFFFTFAITAIWSVPFHTGLMLRRRSSAGQSVAMELSVMAIFASLSAALVQISPAFTSPIYVGFFAVFMAWPLLNIWLIRRLPATPAYPALEPIPFGLPTGRDVRAGAAAAH
jgi:hypothetical protein